MPTHKATWKRLRQDKRRRAQNVTEKSRLRTSVKKLRATCAEGDRERAKEELPGATSLLDKAGKRRTIHPRTAARKKSRLQRLVNKLSG
ncbi:MAG TPA: 30S ribosomal protein S20 [Firmicutes bacterium]|nr:30S ribosomal protein S20 [Bacillota bacterium]